MTLNTQRMKKPTIQDFERVVLLKGTNLSEVARCLGVRRETVWRWVKDDEAFAAILHDSRKRLFDGIFQNSVPLALGVPIYEYVFDNNGNPKIDTEGKHIKRFAGWQERPDSKMAKWLLSKLGKEEGFGDEELDVTPRLICGIPISSWIQMEKRKV